MGNIALILFCIVAVALSAAAIRAFRALTAASAVTGRHSTRQPASRIPTAKRTSAIDKEEKSFPYFA